MHDLLVRYYVLAEVVPDHFRLDREGNEFLPAVDAHGRPHHDREDYHVAGVCLYWILQLALPLGPDILEQLSLVLRDAPVERASRPGRKELENGLGRHRVELVDCVASVPELLRHLAFDLRARPGQPLPTGLTGRYKP